MAADPTPERLFIGGDTSPEALRDLGERLALFGRVLNIEHPPPKPADRPFVYVQFAPLNAQAVHKCIATLNGTAWRGRTLRIERARPDYLDRLRAEWAEQDAHHDEGSNTLPPVTFPIKLPRPRKRHKVVVVEEQGTGSKKTTFPGLASAQPLPLDAAWMAGTGQGLPRPPGQRRILGEPRATSLGQQQPRRQGRQPRAVEHAETREAMQDAIRHALTRARGASFATMAAGAARAVTAAASPPRVADFMDGEDEGPAAASGDLDRFNSSDDERDEGPSHTPRMLQVDGADDDDSDDSGSQDDRVVAGSEERGGAAVGSSSSGSGGGVAGDGQADTAAATSSSEEGSSHEHGAPANRQYSSDAEEEAADEGGEEGIEDDGAFAEAGGDDRATLWGFEGGQAFHRSESMAAVRARWQEARSGLGAAWRSLKRAAGKKRGKKRPRRTGV